MRKSNGNQARFTRRTALKAIAMSVGAASLSEAAWAQAVAVRQQSASDSAAGLRFFTASEHRTVDRLSELIIPADDYSPGASAAKVADFIDYLLSGVNGDEQRIWRRGLETLDRTTTSRWRHTFVDCAADQQISVLTEMAAREHSPRLKLEHLFVRLKERTIQGYYTSEIGVHQELRYKGNTYLDEFVGCNHPEHGA